MNVEHLWFSNKEHLSQEAEGKEISRSLPTGRHSPTSQEPSTSYGSRDSGGEGPSSPGVSPRQREDTFRTLTMMADQRLYKLVKWCKSLPLFKNILVCIIC